jgi:hypothetical protein
MDNFKELSITHDLFISKLNSHIDNNKFSFFKTISQKEINTPITLSSIISDKLSNSLCLLYELENTEPKNHKITSASEMKDLVISIINKFKYSFGYHKFEDSEWTLYDSTSCKYELYNDMFILDNTLCNANRYDNDTYHYVNILSKYIAKSSSDIICDFTYLMDKENDLINVAIICKLKN